MNTMMSQSLSILYLSCLFGKWKIKWCSEYKTFPCQEKDLFGSIQYSQKERPPPPRPHTFPPVSQTGDSHPPTCLSFFYCLSIVAVCPPTCFSIEWRKGVHSNCLYRSLSLPLIILSLPEFHLNRLPGDYSHGGGWG